MPAPDLSIVIVNWNTLEMLRACLASVRDSLDAGPDADSGGIAAETIVIDNASSDGSADMVAAEFPECRLIRNAQNRGFAAANNQGFEIAAGRHILLLNSDTLAHGDVLAASVRYLDAHPQAGAMGCKALNTDGTTQMTCHQYPSLSNQFLMASGLWKLKWPRFLGRYHMTHWQRDDEREVEVISGCYLMLRRAVLEEVGPLDEDFFFFGEETDWCRRMRDAGWTLMFAPVGVITHHGGGSVKKLSHGRDVMLAGAKVRLHRKHGGWPAAAVAWVLAAGFNGSRAAAWSVLALGGKQAARDRAAHFRGVTRDLGKVWQGGPAA